MGISSPTTLLTILAFVFALISDIGVINAFNSNLKERKKQIGLLRSVGATKRQIIIAYGRETFILSLIALIVLYWLEFSTPDIFIISYSFKFLSNI